MFLRLTRLIPGLLLYGVADAFMIEAAVGVDSWTVFAQGISVHTGLSIGLLTNIIGLLVLLPLAAAGLTQVAAARDRRAAAFRDGMTGAMVPLMVLTLATVVASQIATIGGRFGALLLTVPV